ncbi:hypothetical protein MSAN_00617200 [Mycena sanguinolenta]|uniref:Uncharacterized protein n=1 Tax=Mycena sanguinolenta TaxID=230812 RepID=A0A8H7DD03_9AGAR|nr:hypothetical protein MSAN_00617200 [Mycena sanguinolenta]
MRSTSSPAPAPAPGAPARPLSGHACIQVYSSSSPAALRTWTGTHIPRTCAAAEPPPAAACTLPSASPRLDRPPAPGDTMRSHRTPPAAPPVPADFAYELLAGDTPRYPQRYPVVGVPATKCSTGSVVSRTAARSVQSPDEVETQVIHVYISLPNYLSWI